MSFFDNLKNLFKKKETNIESNPYKREIKNQTNEVLNPVLKIDASKAIRPQYKVELFNQLYKIDYAILGKSKKIAIELDGFSFHSDKDIVGSSTSTRKIHGF